MVNVTITDKSGKRETRVFKKADIKIGRDAANDIVLGRGNVSKHHARILHNRGSLVVVDNKSTNGTFVNGERIESPFVLKPSDKVFIGDFVLEVAPGGDATGVEAPPRKPPAHAAPIDSAPTTTEQPDLDPPKRSAGRSPVAVDWDEEWDHPIQPKGSEDPDTDKGRGPLGAVLPGDFSGPGGFESPTDRLAECLRTYVDIDAEYRVKALGADCDCGQCLLCRARQALADFESERG